MISKLIKNLIEFDKYKCIIGCVFALAVFLICALFYSWFAGAVFATAFVLIGSFRLRIENKKLIYILNSVYAVICVFATYYVSCSLIYPSAFPSLQTFLTFNLNILCALIVFGVLYIITANVKASVTASSALLMTMSVVNYFVVVFRDREFTPTDFLTTSTVANVIDQYTLGLPALQSYFLILFLFVMFAQFSLPKWPAMPKIKSRIVMAVAEVAMIVVLCLASVNIPFRTWQTDGTLCNGFYLNFFLGLRAASIEKPDGYSPEIVEKMEKEYPDTQSEQATDKLPNIIVIMNESFADLSIFENELKTNKPVTPFLDSLKENTVRGYALSSVFGGNTANSEFEFLTGHSMAFLPSISIPYQQYIKAPTNTVAREMQRLGYTTFATHPYDSINWMRSTVYPRLGFEKSTFIEEYPSENLIRKYVSDREMYEYTLNVLDEQNTAPLFLFGITMQNHGGYEYGKEDFKQEISLEEYSGDYPKAEQYLSLIHESDKALEYLLSELEEYPEDTIVLFFGDHMPMVENEFYEELAGGPLDTLEEQMKQYTVPFFIWANYDIPEQEVEITSLNYLSRYLLDAAGIELPSYYQFLSEAEENVPAMNVLGYYSKSQEKFVALDEATGEEKEWINKNAILQYNNMFDTKNKNKTFFGVEAE